LQVCIKVESKDKALLVIFVSSAAPWNGLTISKDAVIPSRVRSMMIGRDFEKHPAQILLSTGRVSSLFLSFPHRCGKPSICFRICISMEWMLPVAPD